MSIYLIMIDTIETSNMEDVKLSERYMMYNNIVNFKDFQNEILDKLEKEERVCMSTFSGDGKTTMIKYISLDFVDRIKRSKCIIFINTRILSLDIEESLREILQDDEQHIVCNLSRYEIHNQIKQDTIDRARIFISTPAKFLKMIRKMPTKFDFLCIDEVDSLIESKNNISDIDILNVLSSVSFRYSLVVTATMTDEVHTHIVEKYKYVWKQFSKEYPSFEIRKISFNKRDRDWYMLVCDKIYYILQENITHKRCIVFCNYKEDCDKLYNEYSEPTTSKFCIHGNYSTSEIDLIFKQYQQSGKILFTTDMAQRGLDVKDIDIIFHIGITTENNFYHRNGRTLRHINASPLCFIFYESGSEKHDLVKNFEEKTFNIRR